MDKIFVKDLREGGAVESCFSVKYKKPVKEYKYGYSFEVRVADRTGEITVKYWGDQDKDYVDSIYNSFSVGDVVSLKGEIGSYRDTLDISIAKYKGGFIKPASEGDYSLEDFIEGSPTDISQMQSEFEEVVASVKNPHLKMLLSSFFSDHLFMKEFTEAPASMMLHSNFIGGLMHHTLNVADICEKSASMYPQMDRDLLITGAILHDIGKIRELSMGTNIDITEEGMLLGHITIGEKMVSDAIDKIDGFPEVLKLKVCHMILSHHGKLEWGSPKKPQFPEAIALHYADLIDSQLYQYVKAKKEAVTEDKWIWNKRLEHIYLG